MTLPLRQVHIVCVEGEAENKLFGFLKSHYPPTNRISYKVHNLGGVSSSVEFVRKSRKAIGKYSIKPRSNKHNDNIRFVFFIDNDLTDSNDIASYITQAGHTVQFCNPNTESILLGLAGQPQEQGIGYKDFRKKCKARFSNHFGMEAHEMKDSHLIELIHSQEIFRRSFPLIYSLFND